MSNRKTAISLSKQIGVLFDAGALGAMADRDLLELFARGGEAAEAAFATMVERHGPMVLGVCRQVLSDGHLAEDAFQVTFLLLARRARSIHDPDALAGWLHRVGRRVSLRARAGVYRRKHWEGPQTGDIDVAVVAADALERDELRTLIHDEIDRLASAQRLPILLCALEGLSHEEAARRLGWKLGTVKSRLVRGRRCLQGRLARRGLAPAHQAVPGIDDNRAYTAPVPLLLALGTTRAALQSCPGTASTAARLSASVALLLQRELSALFVAKFKLAAGVAIAGAAAIFIGISLATPLFGRGQELLPLGGKPQPRNAEAPIARRTDQTNTRGTDRGVNAKPGAIPGKDQERRQAAVQERQPSAFGKDVLRAMHGGVQFLLSQQRADGSWADVDNDAKTGVTSLVVLALLAAGEKTDSPAIQRALVGLRGFGPDDLHSTYAISLQTMVFAVAEPAKDEARIRRNVEWLEAAQIKPGDPQLWPGSWSYSESKRGRPGDNSNTQYALLGLHAASEVGIPVKPTVWELSRSYWELSQKRDGSWAYTPVANGPTASMTCAGIATLSISVQKGFQGTELLRGEAIEQCGSHGMDRGLARGIDWLANHFHIDQNLGAVQQWKLYYLAGLERVGRLSGRRFIGEHDWYRVGALALMRDQDKRDGFWRGVLVENDHVLATSFALLFLGKGRAPVLINKLRHGPAGDWNNDQDDVGNLVGIVSRDWKTPMTWQIVDSKKATVSDLRRAPIVFMNGHRPPDLTPAERTTLRAYVEEGGVVFAEACCGSADFDQGFRILMKEMFPKPEEELEPLPKDHPIWQARHRLAADVHPLLGIRRGARTMVIYSPKDLSCYWNQSERAQGNPAVKKAISVGQDVIDYVTGRVVPPDKLSE
jgi:RNA polymerase sigma factor (sigma-70 family)